MTKRAYSLITFTNINLELDENWPCDLLFGEWLQNVWGSDYHTSLFNLGKYEQHVGSLEWLGTKLTTVEAGKRVDPAQNISAEPAHMLVEL